MGLSTDDILKGQKLPYEYTRNLGKLMKALLELERRYKGKLIVTSGYRTPEHNQLVGGKALSRHQTCEAVDFSDQDGKLFSWCQSHQSELVQCGLYVIDPSSYPADRHVHAQIVPPKSGKRIFIA